MDSGLSLLVQQVAHEYLYLGGGPPWSCGLYRSQRQRTSLAQVHAPRWPTETSWLVLVRHLRAFVMAGAGPEPSDTLALPLDDWNWNLVVW